MKELDFKEARKLLEEYLKQRHKQMYIQQGIDKVVMNTVSESFLHTPLHILDKKIKVLGIFVKVDKANNQYSHKKVERYSSLIDEWISEYNELYYSKQENSNE